MESIITAAVTAGGLIVVALINGIMLRNQKADARAREERQKEIDRRDDEALRINIANMEIQHATTKAIKVLLKKATGEHVNGDVEEAKNKIDSAEKKYNDIARETLAGRM